MSGKERVTIRSLGWPNLSFSEQLINNNVLNHTFAICSVFFSTYVLSMIMAKQNTESEAVTSTSEYFCEAEI